MTPPIPEPQAQLITMIEASPWWVRVLTTVRDLGIPEAWVGAGALRDLVWGNLYGHGFDPAGVHDIDVVYFDPDDLTREHDHHVTALLAAAWPGQPWEARNQAAVHLWYHHRFGGDPVPAFRTVEEAVATWPETATSVAARLDRHGDLQLCAPHGLDDLLAGIWRRNPTRVSLPESRARLARHQPHERWPGIHVIPPG